MSTAEERLKILNMIAEKKISAEEGAQLLSALQSTDRKGGAGGLSVSGDARYLRIKVTNLMTGRERASVSIPINLLSVAMRMGARFAPEMEGVSYEEVLSAIQQGMRGKIVDVTEDETGEHVEIFVE